MTETTMHWMLRGYPDWLFYLFVLGYALSSASAIALLWPV